MNHLTMETGPRLTILAWDVGIDVKPSHNVRVVRGRSERATRAIAPCALLLDAASLPAMIEHVPTVEAQAVLIRAAGVPTARLVRWLGQLEEGSDKSVVVHDGELAERLVEAWKQEVAEWTILQATPLPEHLEVLTCGFQRYEVPWPDLSFLRTADLATRYEVEVSEDGFYLHWPSLDIHLDVEAVQVLLDPQLRERAALEKLAQQQQFGAAVRAVRERHGLTQSQIGGLSERQVRRLEHGQGDLPRLTSIEALAAAHGLTSNQYLEEVAEAIAGLPDQA